MSIQWDIAITATKKGGTTCGINFPTNLSRALFDKHFNRCVVTLVKDGILITPYHAEPPTKGRGIVELPDWGSDA